MLIYKRGMKIFGRVWFPQIFFPVFMKYFLRDIENESSAFLLGLECDRKNLFNLESILRNHFGRNLRKKIGLVKCHFVIMI
jgi:hypothetical protein